MSEDIVKICEKLKDEKIFENEETVEVIFRAEHDKKMKIEQDRLFDCGYVIRIIDGTGENIAEKLKKRMNDFINVQSACISFRLMGIYIYPKQHTWANSACLSEQAVKYEPIEKIMKEIGYEKYHDC
jgi:hypothetical protein